MQNFRSLNPFQRRLVFILVVVGVVFLFLALAILLISSALNSAPRVQAIALEPGVAVSEFATLPDEDAYPAAVTVAPDGTVYTGSYASGALWAISPGGEVSEIPNTRDAIGAVAGLEAGPDGALYVVDQIDTDPRSGGGRIVRVTPNGEISPFAVIEDEQGFVTPDDLTFDSAGRLYVSDRGRNEVWRFEPDGSGGVAWWSPAQPEDGPRLAVTGLAYEPATDAIIVTEPEGNTVYRVPVASAEAEVIYQHDPTSTVPPGFDGVTVVPDGTVYLAALGQNGIAVVRDGTLVYIAGSFRGASDVSYGGDNRLYVTNFDQSSLVLPLIEPQRPFALDVVTLAE